MISYNFEFCMALCIFGSFSMFEFNKVFIVLRYVKNNCRLKVCHLTGFMLATYQNSKTSGTLPLSTAYHDVNISTLYLSQSRKVS